MKKNCRKAKQSSLLALLSSLAMLAAVAPGSAADDWQAGAGADWNRVLAAARQEGRVVVASQTSAPGATMSAAFRRDTGIEIEFLSGGVSEIGARIEREAAAGNVTIDVALGGGQELVTLYPRGLLAPLKPQLLLPGVTGSNNWNGGRLKWVDAAGEYLLQTTEYVSGRPVVNTDLVDPKSIGSWNDLLKPEYKGKIASYDPRPGGAGQALGGYLVHTFGLDYLKKLYFGQEITTTRDGRQLVEWAVRGTYPIVLATIQFDIERFRSQGFTNIAPLDLLDGPGLLTGGFSILKQLKNVPHPNAAAVFINWFASRPGQESYARATLEPSRRTDVKVDAIPPYVVPKPGLPYLDQFTEEFYVRVRPKLQKDVVEAFGGR